jgi:nucleoside permease NupC
MIGFVSVSEGVNFILDYVARQMGPNAPAPLQNIRMQPADPLTFSSGITDDGVVTGKLVLPASIGKAGFMAFMQLQQAMQGGGRPGGGPMLP